MAEEEEEEGGDNEAARPQGRTMVRERVVDTD